jgi:hypothetical protein
MFIKFFTCRGSLPLHPLRNFNSSLFKNTNNFTKKFFAFHKSFSTTSENSIEIDKKGTDFFLIDEIKEVLSIQKSSYLENEREEVKEYKRFLDIIQKLNKDFDLDKFKYVMDYLQLNNLDASSIRNVLKDFESIFVKNLCQIDHSTKSAVVMVISKGISNRRIEFNEMIWYKIYRDFINILEMMTFTEFSNYVKAFDNLKKIFPSSRNSYFGRELDNFLNYYIVKYFNSGKIKFSKLEDLIHFSQLIHYKTINILEVQENIWSDINKLICSNINQLDINYTLVIASLFINYMEKTGENINHILSDSIREVNKHVIFLLHNFDLLSYNDQVSLTNFSDTFLYYYKLFLFDGGNVNVNTNTNVTTNPSNVNLAHAEPYLQNLIKIYTIRIKAQDNFNLFHEYSVLFFLAKKLNFKDQEFWSLVAGKVQKVFGPELLNLIKQIAPRLLKNSSMTISEAEGARLIETETSILFYSGIIIDTFSSVNYDDAEFWDGLIKTVDQYVNFKLRDPLTILFFLKNNCRSVIMKENFTHVWDKLTQTFELPLREILKHRQVAQFLIKIYKYSPQNKLDPINIDELNACMTKILNEPGFNLTQIRLFLTFFNLIRSRVSSDDKVKYNI